MTSNPHPINTQTNAYFENCTTADKCVFDPV